MLPIDRTHPFRLSEIDALAPSEALYASADEDEASLRLTSIDTDEVQLIPLTNASERGATSDSNQRVTDKLVRLQADGAVFLDARTLATMLSTPAGIPKHWRNAVASERATPAAGSIRFHGSRFRLLETGDIHVLALSYHRDHWVVELEPVGDDGRGGCVAVSGLVTESPWAVGD